MAKNNVVYIYPDQYPFSQYGGDLLAILDTVDNSSHVIWCDAYEGLRWPSDNDPQGLEDLVRVLGTKDLMLTIVACTDIETVEEQYKDIRDVAEIICWPTYWFHQGFLRYTSRSIAGIQDFPYTSDMGLTYPFISFNAKPRPHRCHMMDHLAEKGLLNTNIATWNVESEYNFEFWEQEIIQNTSGVEKPSVSNPPEWLATLKDYTLGECSKHHPALIDDTFWYSIGPHPMYAQAFMQLVTETSVDYRFITEKTVEPILNQKPFLVLGAQGFHRYMHEELGFFPYNGLFDYSFDDDPDPIKRAEGIVENIERLKGRDLNALYAEHSHTAWNNLQKLLWYVKTQARVPSFIYRYEINHYINLIAHSSTQLELNEHFNTIRTSGF